MPFDRGLAGHSDGDALLHAVTDAILGALGEGDLGARFPSSDERLRGVASGDMLAQVVASMTAAGYRLGNLDVTILAEVPLLSPHQPAMRKRLAELLAADEKRVNLKVTSTDGLGAIGRGEGIGAQAVVLLVADPAEGEA